ncbi:MAG TPA: TadE/TadG family type IV pilus assembly protein [Candidatus Obscuribacterales bacterium]
MEAGAALAFLLPLLILLMVFIIQTSQYFIIKQQLAYIARMAAKECANAYGKYGYTNIKSGALHNSGAANTSDADYLAIVNGIACPGVFAVNSGNANIQVNFTFPTPGSLNGSYVTAQVRYANGPNLPVFPWNPVKGGFAVLNFSGITVRSSATWPIPH